MTFLAMAKLGNLEKIESARLLLKASLENSKNVAYALDETGSRLGEIDRRLASLEGEVGTILTRKRACETVVNQIGCLIGSIGAVLKAYNTVCELDVELSLSDPKTDLFTHVTLVKRLEEGLQFLSSNCGLASQWLQDVLRLVKSNALGVVAKDVLFLSLKSSLRILEHLHELEGRAHLRGGLIYDTIDKLEKEFSRLLVQNTTLIPMEEDCSATTPLLLPDSVVQKLQTIIKRLETNHRLEKCVSLFIEVRVSNARRSLQALDLEYLDAKITTVDDMQVVESYIKQWGKHLELAVKCLFKHEYKLCDKVFEQIGSDSLRKACFARIAVESGILSFLRFGVEFINIKKDAIKLLKLLDVFKILNNLRADFSQIFGNSACSEIQTPTRDLVKKLVDGACDIFWELPTQVASQRRFSSPPDGSVPRLVSFLTKYCNQLLGEDYMPALTEVLTIQSKWKQEDYEEALLMNQFYNIMKEIGLNLDEWSKAYAEISLSYLFMMNNHCHFCNLKGTKLGDVMGRSWLSAHEQYKAYYAALYLQESWANILPYLSQKGVFSIAARETSPDFNMKMLKAFNDAFEEKYEKHSKWVISDEAMRRNVRNLVVTTVVPAYKSYIKTYRALVEQDASAGKYVKHTSQSLETKLGSLFQPKLIKHCGSRNARIIGRIKSVITNQFCATLTAM